MPHYALSSLDAHVEIVDQEIFPSVRGCPPCRKACLRPYLISKESSLLILVCSLWISHTLLSEPTGTNFSVRESSVSTHWPPLTNLVLSGTKGAQEHPYQKVGKRQKQQSSILWGRNINKKSVSKHHFRKVSVFSLLMIFHSSECFLSDSFAWGSILASSGNITNRLIYLPCLFECFSLRINDVQMVWNSYRSALDSMFIFDYMMIIIFEP